MIAACSTGQPIPEIAAAINSTLSPTTYRISPGDLLRVQYAHNPDWSHETTVREDGHASFLFLGDVFVAGQSLIDIQERIQSAQQEDGERQSQVVVEVASRAARFVLVLGEVTNPGQVDLDSGALTLIDAIGKSGGPLKRTAELSSVILIRYTPTSKRTDHSKVPWATTWSRRSWKIDAELEYWGHSEPIYLQPNDIVFVSNTSIDDVNIWVDQYIRQMIPIPNPWAFYGR